MSSRSPIRKDGIAQSEIASQDELRIVPRVVQSGDGRDESERSPESPANDPDTTSTSEPSDAGIPAPRAVGPDDPTRTRSGDASGGIALPPRPGADRLPAPLQYRDPERYQIVAEHGRGGLGRVYRARDKELGRDVALKELLQRGTTSELRFFREALITARLEHPGIVPVHEAGRWPDGTPFYAMKLVAGRPLKDLIAECKTLEERLALLPHVIAVADAIAYAHDRKIIHRDLKPSNIIVGDFGETVVIDWGLAKDIQADPADPAAADLADGPYRTPADDGVTVAGTVVGTPAYMSPEQARGEPVDERTDVYAIGMILRALLTSDAQLLVPDEPKGATGSWTTDLYAIVAKCTAKDRRLRYPAARALAVDLRRFVTGTRVDAQTYSLGRLLAFWLRRHRTLAVALAAAAATAIAIGGLALVSIVSERDRAESSRQAAELAFERSTQERHNALRALAELTLARDPTAAVRLIDQLPDDSQARLLRSRAQAAGVAKTTVNFRGNNIYNLTPVPTSGTVLVVTADRHLRAVEIATGRTNDLAERLSMPARLDVNGDRIAYVTDGETIAIVEHSLRERPRTVRELPAMPKQFLYAAHAMYWVDSSDDLYELAAPFSGAAVRVASGIAQLGKRASGTIWCTQGGELVERLHAKMLRLGPCSPTTKFVDNGDYVVFGASAQTLTMRAPEGVFAIGRTAGSAMPDVDYHVSASGLLAMYDSDGQGSVRVSPEHNTRAFPLRFDAPPAAVAAGNALAVWAFTDGSFFAYEPASDKVWKCQAHDGPIQAIIIFDGVIVSMSGDTLRFWTLESMRARVVAKLPSNIYSASVDPAHRYMALDGSSGACTVLSLDAAARSAQVEHVHEALSFGVAWCGSYVCSGGWDSAVRCTDRRTKSRLEWKTPGYVRWITANGNQCYFASSDGGIWSASDGRRLYSHAADPTRVAYDSDTGLLASVDTSGTLILYDVTTSKVIAKAIGAHNSPVVQLQWELGTLWSLGVDGALMRRDRDLRMLEQYALGGDSGAFAVAPGQVFATQSGRVLWMRNRDSGAVHEISFRAQITAIALSDDHATLMLATSAGEVFRFAVPTLEIVETYSVGAALSQLFILPGHVMGVGFDGFVLDFSAGLKTSG